MQSTSLKCPSCSGQMKLAEVKPGDKIAICEYCNTTVDLPDTAEKQHFDLNGFLEGLNLNHLKNSNTTTITTSTVVIKNGVVMNSDGASDDVLNTMNEVLKKSRIQVNEPEEIVIPDRKAELEQKKLIEQKKSFFKRLFGK